jgi:hypothetical protein
MRADAALIAGAFVGSMALTVVLIVVLHIPLVLLFLPIIPFLLRPRRRTTVKRCASCGWQTDDPRHEYCPCDGSALVTDTIY